MRLGPGRLRQTSVYSSQSLDPEQPGLCVFYIEVASNVTVDWRSVGVKLSSHLSCIEEGWT